MVTLVSDRNRVLVDRLFRRHHDWLVRWLNKQRWTVSSSEDLASDVFVALLGMPCVNAIREPRAIMTTVARRLICDARRRDDLRRSYEAELALLPEAMEISADERLIIVQTLQAIDRMLAGLSDNARRAFLLSQVEGAAYAEIAAELGVSVSMVRKYVAQGLRAAYAAAASQN